MPVTEVPLDESIAHALRSAHVRWGMVNQGKRFLGEVMDRMLTDDEYRWLAVAAMREYRKRTLRGSHAG